VLEILIWLRYGQADVGIVEWYKIIGSFLYRVSEGGNGDG